MRVLAISHSCVTDVNQQLFVELASIPGVEVGLLVPARWRSEYGGREVFRPRFLESVDFPVYQAPVAMPGHISLHFYTRLPMRALRAFRPDVLLSTQEPWSLSGLQALRLAKRLRVPLVFQTNQNILKRYPFPFGQIEARTFRSASAALAFSEEARQVMLQKGVRCPSAVVPYGIDLRLFYPGKSPEIRERLGLSGSVVFGYMGRLVEEKGLDTLVDAAAVLRGARPSLRFRVLLVGSGDVEPSLRSLARKRGVEDLFVFAGSVPHLEAGDYMRSMDAFVLPSRTRPNWKEQFGRVIIEAMACGIPVVGSDSGEIPHLLRATQGGLVFHEGDSQELARQLERLAIDAALRAELGATGREAVECRYTFKAVAHQLYEHLQSAVSSDTLPRK